MIIKNIFFKVLLVVATTGIIFTGCKKDTEEEDTDTTSSSDNALAEATFNDVSNISDEAGQSGSVNSYKMGGTDGILSASCATVINDTISTPRQLSIDFGATNCMCLDGRNRRGRIIIAYSGHYHDSASTHTISFNNYFVNDHQVTGTKTVKNNGHNAAGHLNWTVTVDGNIILANGGGTISWASNRTREWTAGETTLSRLDDIYAITGSGSGTGSSGKKFSATITSPLILKLALGCRAHFVQGKFDFTPEGKATRTVDYGSGTCDDIATVTIKGNTYTVKLR